MLDPPVPEPPVPATHVRRPRAEPPELTELRRLKLRQPELVGSRRPPHRSARAPASGAGPRPDAVDRRRARVVEDAARGRQAAAPLRGHSARLDRFPSRLPPDRRRAASFRRHRGRATTPCARRSPATGNTLEPVVVRWFDDDRLARTPTERDAPRRCPSRPRRSTRCSASPCARSSNGAPRWCSSAPTSPPGPTPSCPLCGGEPEFGVLTSTGDRVLICGRCTARWRFDAPTCPYCGNADRASLPSFASGDGLYRLYACDGCRRYIKAYDARQGGRPVMLAAGFGGDAAAGRGGDSARVHGAESGARPRAPRGPSCRAGPAPWWSAR